MPPENQPGQRNVLHYALFLLVVLALVITPTILYLAAVSIFDIVWQTILVVLTVAILAYAIHWLYNRSQEQP